MFSTNPPRNGAEASGAPASHVKRSRVLLSCGACRNSKLKCDRAVPCGQCRKKGKPGGCAYTPRAEKQKPAKSMTARLKRLEGMVRGMIDTDGASVSRTPEMLRDVSDARGQVVRGDRATSYVGGTHFMAILEDIDELKNFFEYPDDDESEANHDPHETAGSPEFLLLSQNVPRNKDELLAMLPERSVIDRLMMRYFNSNSPSQHILHKPTFSKQYHQFWLDPSSASLHWIAILFMVASLGVFFSSFQAPHELETDSHIPVMDRIKLYRGAAGTALIWGKYSQPNQDTLQGFLLYVEAEFLINRHSQMNCYLLCATFIRTMLKMGLHRDPSKLPNISPYDGEMRRRIWNLGIQVDLLVAFHLGLPAMIHGIESDTALPRNLLDDDFSEDSRELPLARPSSDYTPLSYPVSKAALCRVFGLVARHAHSLTVPSYTEVMKLDEVLEETYKQIPPFLKVKLMEESITDAPMQVIQRFGLASLYQKSRCVLHRKYITDALPKKEHEYSRKTCLSAALALLDYQNVINEACKPGAMLGQNGWFLASLAINDFLLADMIVALVVQSEHYSEVGGNHDWIMQGTPTPAKEELLRVLRRSLSIWQQMAVMVPDCRKAADVVKTILRRVETQMGIARSDTPSAETPAQISEETDDSMAGLSINGSRQTPMPMSNDAVFEQDLPPFLRVPHPELNYGNASGVEDAPWMGIPSGYDWNHFDALTRGAPDQPAFQMPDQLWLDINPLDDLDFITSTPWNPVPRP
ncbi:fungal-specific transcription factor domain-containing protein [Xylariales sp. AK1849]|nr:fungal-specific transcription factor domain-containing protein [Xylariales sp. AK1849]